MATSASDFQPVGQHGDFRARLVRVAEALAVAAVISLPWSTTATGVLIVIWAITLIPTLDRPSLSRELSSVAGGAPVLLWALGAIGMLWADVSWGERIAGLSGFHKLLAVPLLLAQFRRGGNANWVILGLLVSCLGLLTVSWFLVLWPGLSWRGNGLGVPVKSYIFQSEVFALCALGLTAKALELWLKRRRLALGLILIAAVFLANVGYVATARTTLVVIVVLVLLLGWRQLGWKGALAASVAAGIVAGSIWASSPYLRERVAHAVTEANMSDAGNAGTPVGLRLGFWEKSLIFVSQAPLMGHGTGSIPKLFRNAAVPGAPPGTITANPHNQIFAVAIPLGLIGVAALLAMWIGHLALFRNALFCSDFVTWCGLMVVVENVVGGMFNSQLFDFTEGWLYVLGVGILGRARLAKQAQES